MAKKLKYVYLFADLVGSTCYKERHSYEIGWKKIKKHCQIAIDQILKHEGEVFKLVGDGVIGKFTSTDSNIFDRTLNTALSIILAVDRYNVRNGLKNRAKCDDMIETKIGIGFGKSSSYEYKDFKDDVGECIDISARLSSITLPNTLLFEREMLESIVRSDFKKKFNNDNLFNSIIENVFLKGKTNSIDLVIIGLNDIKPRYKSPQNLVKSFKSKRSLGDIIYISVGGFMHSNKTLFVERIANKFNGHAIKHDNLKNPHLEDLWKIKERNEELATKTNLWYVCHHYKCLKEGFKKIESYDIFVSNFNIDYNLFYSEGDYANTELINNLYDICISSKHFKEPDFKILLEASPRYYLHERDELEKSGSIEYEYEKLLTIDYYKHIVAKYDIKYRTPKDDNFYKINIEELFNDKSEIDRKVDAEVDKICSKIKKKISDRIYRR